MINSKFLNNHGEKILLIILTFIFFILPSFWMGNNQFHLGGDDSRIYLSDPHAWLVNIGFWPKVTVTFFSSGIPQHLYLPFVFFAGFLQKLLFFMNIQSFWYGMSLSLGFLSMYLLIREFLQSRNIASYISGVMGGLLYVLLPLSYITFFLNPVKYLFIIFLYPLFLYFYLKAVHKKDIRYLAYGALLSAIFSISFSEIPYLYAFVIGCALFFVSYTLLVYKLKIRWLLVRYAFFYGVLIVLFNFFWLLPFFAAPFYGDSIVSSAVSEKVRNDNLASIKLGVINHNLIDTLLVLKGRMSFGEIAFMKPIYSLSFINVLFPVILFSGIFMLRFINARKKLYISLLVSFLILAFLQTVNIGNWGPETFEYLVKTVPGFVSLRNFDYKVAPTYLIFFSLTFSFSIYFILTTYARRKKLITALIGIICLLLVGNALPLFNGQVISFSLAKDKQFDRRVIIPDDYLNLLKDIIPTWPESRIITLPLTFGSWSIFLDERNSVYMGHPLTQIIGGRDSIGGRVSFFDTGLNSLESVVSHAFIYEDYDTVRSLLGFLNVSNFIYHPSVFEKDTPKDFLSTQLWNYPSGFTEKRYQGFLKTIEQNKQLSKSYEVYKIPQTEYIPRVYTSTQAIEIEDFNTMLPDIAFLRTLNNNAVISEKNKFRTYPNQQLLSPLKEYDVLQENCIECSVAQTPDISLPFARILPNSPLYKYITWKENREEDQIQQSGDLSILVDKKLELSSKRVTELDMLLDQHANEGVLITTLQQFDKQMNSIFTIVNNSNDTKLRSELLISLDRYIFFYKSKLDKFTEKLPPTNVFGELLQQQVDKLERKLAQKNDRRWVSEGNTLRYVISSPTTDEFDMYIKNYDLAQTRNVQMNLNQRSFSPELESYSKNLFFVGRYEFNAGENLVSLNYPSQNLVPGDIQSFIIENSSDKIFSIPNYDWKVTYKVEFDYTLASERPATVQAIQDNEFIDEYGIQHYGFSKDLTPSRVMEHVSLILTPNVDAKTAVVRFSTRNRKGAILQIKNLQIKQNITPSIVLVHKSKEQKVYTAPNISFQRINPIRYEVTVENAQDPYLLVLADSYHKGWMVSMDNKSDNLDDPISYTYLNGKVKELSPKNTLFKPEFLWAGKEIAKDRHISVNGYANAWYITPQDVDGKKSYRLLITYWPQNFFYVASIVSLLSVVCVFFYLWKANKNKK